MVDSERSLPPNSSSLPGGPPSFGRRALLGGVAALSVGALAGCGGTGSAGAGGAKPKLQLGVGIDAAYAPMFLAAEKGLFDKAGLDVKLVQFGRGGEAADACSAGQIQMVGNSDVTTLQLMATATALRALSVFQESGRYLKLTVAPKVNSARDIKNFGIVPGLSELATVRYLESQKIDPKSIKQVSVAPAEMPALLQKGDVDAYVLWEPWPQKGKDLGGKILGSTGDWNFFYHQWIIANADWLGANAATAAKVIRVIADSCKQGESDPKAAADATLKAAKFPADQTTLAIEQIDFGVRAFTDADIAAYRKHVEYFVSTGKLKGTPDIDKYIDRQFYAKNVQA